MACCIILCMQNFYCKKVFSFAYCSHIVFTTQMSTRITFLGGWCDFAEYRLHMNTGWFKAQVQLKAVFGEIIWNRNGSFYRFACVSEFLCFCVSYSHFLLQMMSPIISLNIVLDLWIALYTQPQMKIMCYINLNPVYLCHSVHFNSTFCSQVI
jgi:hypothetical protein